eukprot:GHVQ01032912.1.p1 GENE.GHVQ01032912.1~~GHVQ01032912.1.p1  ORF type:complete len:116 (-),score=17.49 GHVQ01032912.1:346-693(-)
MLPLLLPLLHPLTPSPCIPLALPLKKTHTFLRRCSIFRLYLSFIVLLLLVILFHRYASSSCINLLGLLTGTFRSLQLPGSTSSSSTTILFILSDAFLPPPVPTELLWDRAMVCDE